MLSILRLVLSLCLCGYDFPLSLLFMIGFLGWFLIFCWLLLLLKVCCLCIWWEVSCLWCWCCFQFIFYHWICCSNFWQYSHWCCFCNSFSVLINFTTFIFFGGRGYFLCWFCCLFQHIWWWYFRISIFFVIMILLFIPIYLFISSVYNYLLSAATVWWYFCLIDFFLHCNQCVI